MKKDPPRGSVVCWSELTMLAPASNRNRETAATVPGRSAQELGAEWYVVAPSGDKIDED